MTPITMFHYRGFLIRIVDNGAQHPFKYEWTVDPISPKAKATLRPWWRKWQPNHVRKTRVYDPTSTTTRSSAIYYGKDEVDGILAPVKSYPVYNLAC